MKKALSAVVLALGLASGAAFAADADSTVTGSTVNNTASGNRSKAEVDIGSTFGSAGGFLGIGSKAKTAKATVTNSTINNTASGNRSEARVRIGSAY
jgi:hypothetical protein